MRYVILLRGVNVGGSRRVPKAAFKEVLESLGFRDVIVYINSGNAVFSSDTEPHVSDIQDKLEDRFGFVVPTLLIPGEKIQKIAAAIPVEWTNDAPKPDKSGQKSDVVYLFNEVNTPDVIEKLGYKPDVETMLYIDGAVLTNISRANQMKGSLQRIVSSNLYKQVTIRNISTAKKLAELVKD